MRFAKFSFLALFSFFLFFSSCKAKEPVPITGKEIPDWINDFPPEDAIWGIGIAKTESDGESILLAEDRARVAIARQLSTSVNASENLAIQNTNIHVSGSKVLYREKDKDGAWWCLIELAKANYNYQPSIESEHSIILDKLRVNAAELSNMDLRNDIIRNVETLTLDWIFKPLQYQPEDMLYGLGGAKLDNDEESIQLAKERARQSLARSLHTKVEAAFYDYNINDESESYQEDNFSTTSQYDHSAIQMEMLHLAKTKDGTWWVLLGCSSRELYTSEEIEFSTSKAEEALRLLDKYLESLR